LFSLLFLVLISVLLSIPSLQTRLGKAATNYLSRTFEVEVAVAAVDCSFLGTVQLNDVLIKDHHADTLIYVGKLKTDVLSYRNILNNELTFGRVSLHNFVLNIKKYPHENTDALAVFVDKFSVNRPKRSTSFLLDASRLSLRNGNLEIDDLNFPAKRPISFKNIHGTVNNFRIDGSEVYAQIQQVGFLDHHGVQVTDFSSDFTYTRSFMNFQNAILKTPTSTVLASVRFDYNPEERADFSNKANINARIEKASLSLSDLQQYNPAIGTDGRLYLTAELSGVLNDLVFKKFHLTAGHHTLVDANLHLQNAFNTKKGTVAKANIAHLTTDYPFLENLMPGALGATLPGYLQTIGKLTMTGEVLLSKEQIEATLRLKTLIGNMTGKLRLNDLGDPEGPSYQGTLTFKDLALGSIATDKAFGNSSFQMSIDGKGLDLRRANTAFQGEISSLQYRQYTYRDISLQGSIKDAYCKGMLEVNDPNVKLNLSMQADLSREQQTYKATALVDYLDLKAVRLVERDSISNLKGEVQLYLTGQGIDGLSGTVHCKNTLYSNLKEDFFFKDLSIVSDFENGLRDISIRSSDIIEGNVRGNFKFDELLALTKNSLGKMYSNYREINVSPAQEIHFRFKIFNKIVEVFFPGVHLAANTFIQGTINPDEKLFRLTVKSPEIHIDDNHIDQLNLQVDTRNPLFNSQLTIDRIGTNHYDISKFNMVNISLNDTLFFKTEFLGGKAETANYDLSFYHTLTDDHTSVLGFQPSNIAFKNNRWEIDASLKSTNRIVYDSRSGRYEIGPFLIGSNDQEIAFSGVVNDSLSTDMALEFKAVKLEDISPEIDKLQLEGLLNGKLRYTQSGHQRKPAANININNLRVNGLYQGDLTMGIEGMNSLMNYQLRTSLRKDGHITFSTVGELDVGPSKPLLDVIVDFDEFDIAGFSPLGGNVASHIRGDLYGNVNLTGLLSNPAMTGDLFLDKAGLFLPYLNVDYQMDGTTIVALDNQVITFEDVTLRDRKHGSRGHLTGTLRHDYFKDWYLDLALDSENLLVLDTQQQENASYFGTGFLQGIVTLTGPTDKLLIDLAGKTNKGTHFVIPVREVKTAEDSQLIRFVDRKNPGNDQKNRNEFIAKKLKGVRVNLDLEVTKEATFEMTLDQATGSALKGTGTGNIQVQLDTKDRFDMYGDFTVDNGVYNFRYGGFINKPFTVQKGGSISWSGDPFTALIDIETVYRVSANPKPLLENIAISRKIPIDLIARFSGELFSSQRDFDIKIPNANSMVASELAFKLNDNNAAKTSQFVSLLASGAFYNENNLSVNTRGLAYGTTADLVSNAFDNIFNKGDNRFKFKPVYTVGEQDVIQQTSIDDQFAIDLDYQVNDRILINGRVGVPIRSKEQSTVIGEVNFEFLLNPQGTFRSTMFNRQNEIQYTHESEGYTQGLGLSYQIDFDTGGELFRKLGFTKRREKTSQNLNDINN